VRYIIYSVRRLRLYTYSLRMLCLCHIFRRTSALLWFILSDGRAYVVFTIGRVGMMRLLRRMVRPTSWLT